MTKTYDDDFGKPRGVRTSTLPTARQNIKHTERTPPETISARSGGNNQLPLRSSNDIFSLQRTMGNQAVQRLLGRESVAKPLESNGSAVVARVWSPPSFKSIKNAFRGNQNAQPGGDTVPQNTAKPVKLPNDLDGRVRRTFANIGGIPGLTADDFITAVSSLDTQTIKQVDKVLHLHTGGKSTSSQYEFRGHLIETLYNSNFDIAKAQASKEKWKGNSEVKGLKRSEHTTLEVVSSRAAARADDDYQAALDRIEDEMNIPADQAPDILKRALEVVGKAPLTLNFKAEKLDLILQSGGIKNFWEVRSLNPDRYTKESVDKRVGAEHRMFDHADKVDDKVASEEPKYVAANITNYKSGSAPTGDYGFSHAILKESIKSRVTYAPFDSFDLVTRAAAGEGFFGPEVVATPQNLAAIIKYADIKTLKDIIRKAQDPNTKFDMPSPVYVEAHIHGPLRLSDIKEFVFNTDMEVYTEDEQEAVKSKLATFGIKVSFATSY